MAVNNLLARDDEGDEDLDDDYVGGMIEKQKNIIEISSIIYSS